MSPMSAAQMTRAGIHEVLAASFDLPPGHMSEKTRLEFLHQVFIAYAWCIREELLNSISVGDDASVPMGALRQMRDLFAAERKTAADNLGDFGRALALQNFPEREGTTH